MYVTPFAESRCVTVVCLQAQCSQRMILPGRQVVLMILASAADMDLVPGLIVSAENHFLVGHAVRYVVVTDCVECTVRSRDLSCC